MPCWIPCCGTTNGDVKGGCALASRGYVLHEYDDDQSPGDSKITFAGKAKFKDNFCDVRMRERERERERERGIKRDG